MPRRLEQKISARKNKNVTCHRVRFVRGANEAPRAANPAMR
jgi:hypothetical protein